VCRSQRSLCLGSSLSRRLSPRGSLVRPHLLKVAFPSDCSTEVSCFCLLLEAEEGAEAKFHRFLFCAKSSGLEGVLHEFVIYDNVGAHEVYVPGEMYTSYTRWRMPWEESNCAINPTPELAHRSSWTLPPARLSAALGIT